MVLFFPLIAAIPTVIGVSEGIASQRRDASSAPAEEKEQLRKFALECCCEGKGRRAREVDGGRVVVRGGKVCLISVAMMRIQSASFSRTATNSRSTNPAFLQSPPSYLTLQPSSPPISSLYHPLILQPSEQALGPTPRQRPGRLPSLQRLLHPLPGPVAPAHARARLLHQRRPAHAQLDLRRSPHARTQPRQ